MAPHNLEATEKNGEKNRIILLQSPSLAAKISGQQRIAHDSSCKIWIRFGHMDCHLGPPAIIKMFWHASVSSDINTVSKESFSRHACGVGAILDPDPLA